MKNSSILVMAFLLCLFIQTHAQTSSHKSTAFNVKAKTHSTKSHVKKSNHAKNQARKNGHLKKRNR